MQIILVFFVAIEILNGLVQYLLNTGTSGVIMKVKGFMWWIFI